jgi:hypothetical protein
MNKDLEGRDGQVYVGTHTRPKIRENVSPHTHKGARLENIKRGLNKTQSYTHVHMLEVRR